VSGKIVIFSQDWQGYGHTVKYRRSAGQVERAGGVGLLIKSVAPFSLSTPHTGSGYGSTTNSKDAGIPAASISLEEAELLKRLYNRGKQIVVQMDIKSKSDGICSSKNTVFDIRGEMHQKANFMVRSNQIRFDPSRASCASLRPYGQLGCWPRGDGRWWRNGRSLAGYGLS
jgi:hypothetical protein